MQSSNTTINYKMKYRVQQAVIKPIVSNQTQIKNLIQDPFQQLEIYKNCYQYAQNINTNNSSSMLYPSNVIVISSQVPKISIQNEGQLLQTLKCENTQTMTTIQNNIDVKMEYDCLSDDFSSNQSLQYSKNQSLYTVQDKTINEDRKKTKNTPIRPRLLSSDNKSPKQSNENTSKNVLKIYLIAFLKYIQDNQQTCTEIASEHGLKFQNLLKNIKKIKNKKVSIENFKKIMKRDQKQGTKYDIIFRKLSYKFMREEKVAYFYGNKKIKKVGNYVYYRHSLKMALERPSIFNKLKIQDEDNE